MQHLFRAAVVVCLVGSPVFAQQPAATGAFVPWANKLFGKENPTPAVLVHDFGTVPHGTMLTHKFTITNIYDVPLQVIDVRKSCTCLEAYPPQAVIPPNESAELAVTMNAGKFTGPNAQTFFVTVGPQYVSTAVIRVQATSRADVTLTPGQVNFGVVPQGSAPVQTVGVKYTGKQKDWKLVGAVPPAGPLEVSVSEAGRGEFRVTVKLDAKAAGPLSEPVSLKTNDPSAPLLTLNVSAAVQAPISVAPAMVRFDAVKVGTEQTLRVVLRGGKAFRVSGVDDVGDGLSAEPLPFPAPVQIVTVRFAPKAAGAVKRELRFETDLGGAAGVLTVEAEGVP